MKTKFTAVFILLMMSLMMATDPLWAAPQRLGVKTTELRGKQKTARTQLKTINLQNIEDPEARRAIREILNYLNLETQE